MAIIERDSSGQLWQITVNPDGSLTSTPASSDLNFAPAFSRDATGQLWQITVTSDGGITTAKVADTDTNTVQLAASPQWLSRDPDGNLWQLAVNADGSITTTPSTDAPTPTEADGCTVTLQSTVDLCRTHVDLMPLASVGGFSQEPALSLANDTLQELCAQPYDWKFNSKDYGLLTTHPARQDYLYAGASAFVIGVGSASIALADGSAITMDGTTVTVRCLQPHGFTVGQTVYMTGNTSDTYNSSRIDSAVGGWTGGWVITATPDALTFTFTHVLSNQAASGAPGITDLAWLASAEMYDLSSNEALPRTYPIDVVKSVRKTGSMGRPEKLGLRSQSAGILTIRLSHISVGTTFGITLTGQKKPPLKTDLSETWSPFPDEFGFVYRQAFLARCYRFLDKPRADNETAKAEMMIAKALGRDDVEESDQYVSPERSLMGDYGW
jgi:hypothetical protein